ncbi:YihY/virulence factor BrkB family protein [Halococcoides cellulosivorans]|uniref:YihY/virulence factor BrkB family protein n=1 Tax=Halococcoides cellulosivorans TaxID=1679096 RepID=A0A2R4WZ82_9EURY|nr:YihY/virulence factor BrkB family protein [Halococcoides cellulosivorans]AWB26847.1 YihY/virulence factor BrkB family protein [Halococcoides cellulosivorans]
MSTLRAIYTLALDRDLGFVAAAIAYYAFVSTLPLALLAIAIGSVVGGPALADRVTGVLATQLSASGQDFVTRTLTDASGRGAASLVGLAVLAWSGSKLFRALDRAFDQIDSVETTPSFIGQLTDAVVASLAVSLAAVLVVASGVALSIVPPGGPLLDLLATIALVALLTIAFLPLYYLLPPVDVTVGEALPGAGVAAIGWVALQIGFRIYAASATRFAAYGLLGSVLLFVTWLYVASEIVLLGGVVNVVVRTERPGWWPFVS